MRRLLDPAIFVSQNLTPHRWIMTCRLYAIGTGLLACLLDFGFDLSNEQESGETLLGAATIGVVVWAIVAYAFRIAREVSVSLSIRMATRVEEIVKTGILVPISSHGWEVFDRLQDGLQQLLVPRDARIAALEQEVEYYRRLAEGMQGLELVFDLDGHLRWVNPGAETLTGYSREECLTATEPAEPWIYAKDRPMFRELIAQARQGLLQDNVELRVQRKDESVVWCACRCYPLRNAEGQIAGLRFSAQDIQPRKDADLKLLETVAALRRAQALKEHYLGRSNDERMRLAALLEIVELGILFVDRDRRVVYINQTCADMWQLGERSSVVGMRDSVLLDATAVLRMDDAAYRQHVEQAIAQRSQQSAYDIHCPDGRIVRERSSIVPASEGGRAIGRVWIYEDITERLSTQRRLTELAERDPLTNLYNRRRFDEDLEYLRADALRRGEPLGLIFFDLDGFKEINDAFGHHAGDEVLKRIAAEVGRVVRRNEQLFRFGGDEFAILVAQPSDEGLTHLAQRVVAKVASLGFEFGGCPARVTISLGITMASADWGSAEALIQAADRIMYQAKSEGRNRWVMASLT